MVVRLVMRRPQPGQGGHRDEDAAAPSELRLRRPQRADIVRHMLQHVQEHDEVKAPVGGFQPVGEGAEADADAALPLGDGAGLGIELHRLDSAETAQKGEIAARSAADFQEPGGGRFRQVAADQPLDDPPAPIEPPMLVLLVSHSEVDGSFHARPLASASPPNPKACLTM